MRNARYLIATAMFTLGACQCLTVVKEDGGEGGGAATGGGSASGGGGSANGGGGANGGGSSTGGGLATGGGAGGGGTGGGGGAVDAGSNDGGCATYLDCSGSEGNVTFCQGVEGSSSYSCIDGQCLWECHGHRDCEHDGGCETCTTPVSNECGMPGCVSFVTGCTGRIEQSTCGTFDGESISASGDAACGVTIGFCDGGTFGSWVQYDANHAAGTFAPFGECTAEQLPTGAIRWVVNCPGCQLVVQF